MLNNNSSSLINIRRDVGDKFYRYKMPKIISKIEGRGNGIKTVVPNMTDVAKALHRPATYVIKFFGCELGSQATFDVKNEKYVVNGAHDAEKLQNLLDVFINKFVLCPSCMNPETVFEITKDDDILKNCKACGAIKPVDMRHKLVAFILKNPENAASAKKSKKDKRSKKGGSKETSEQATPDPGQSQDEADGDDELTRRINEEAANLPRATSLDDGWAEDTSPEAVARRMKDLQVSGAVDKLMDDVSDLEDPFEALADFVSENPEASAQEIKDKAEDLGVRTDKACTILAQVVFDSGMSAKQVQKWAPMFKKFLDSPKSQRALLGGLERLVTKVHPELLPKIAVILKLFYDADLVEEEVFLHWAEKPSKKYVEKSVGKQIREKAQPFIKWLQEAEESSDEE